MARSGSRGTTLARDAVERGMKARNVPTRDRHDRVDRRCVLQFGFGYVHHVDAILARHALRVVGQLARPAVAESLILQDAFQRRRPGPGLYCPARPGSGGSWPSQLRKHYNPARTSVMLYLIDASVFIFRAYFSVPIDVADRDGNPVNAVHGFARFLGELLEREMPLQRCRRVRREPRDAVIATRSIPAYKANREPAPVELKRQFALCREVCTALWLAQYGSSRFEADDIIGTLTAARAGRRRAGHDRQSRQGSHAAAV